MRGGSEGILVVGLVCLATLASCSSGSSTPGPEDAAVEDVSVDDGMVDTTPVDLSVDETPREETVLPDVAEDRHARELAEEVEVIEEISEEPVFWTADATVVVHDLDFISVEGKPFFAIGFDTHSGLVWDGVAGFGECDRETGAGYLDINVEKTHAAAAAGANFTYVWSYGPHKNDLVATTPRLYGIFHSQWSVDPPEDRDVIPIVLNAFGEEDVATFDPAKVETMKTAFQQFMNREGPYSLDVIPNLPAVGQVGHMAWHPTWRIIGRDEPEPDSEEPPSEMLTHQQAVAIIQTTNMSIADNYTYVENRFDWNEPVEAFMAAGTGQKGEKGEDYEYWLDIDCPDHRSNFVSNWQMMESLQQKKLPQAVNWIWLQGYGFSTSIAEKTCEGKPSDYWATGKFPSEAYLRKEITAAIAAYSTGFVFFGFFKNLWPETDRMLKIMRALSLPEVYDGALVSPRLDLGYDTSYMGEEGYDGRGRAHVMVKWHEASKTAYLVISNPGARATTVDIEFPWSLESAQILDWDTPAFGDSPDLQILNRVLRYTVPRDDGVILKVSPLVTRD